MPFFPMLSAPGCEGFTILSNFPPNNWEITGQTSRYANVTWLAEGRWRSESIGRLTFGELMCVNESDLSGLIPSGSLLILSLTTEQLPEFSDSLPKLDRQRSVLPVWRATVGLKTKHAVTSYQGEIDPFPPSGSLLTFCPFIQYGDGVANYLILVSLEALPEMRKTKVEFYDAQKSTLRGVTHARSNTVNIFRLDDFGFESEELPLIICRGMAAIPLYFSVTADGAFLSLEHTHPPASLVIHGNRWHAQKILKEQWYERTKPPC